MGMLHIGLVYGEAVCVSARNVIHLPRRKKGGVFSLAGLFQLSRPRAWRAD